MMNDLRTLIKYEMRDSRKIFTFFLIIIAVIYLMYSFFLSKSLQFAALMLFDSPADISYYHMIALPVLTYSIPVICLILMYDVVNKDIREERLRLMVTKVKRSTYLFSKLWSNYILIELGLLLIVAFLTLYSLITLKISMSSNLLPVYLTASWNLFFSLSLVSLFICSIYLLVSCFAKNPLGVAVLVTLLFFMCGSFYKMLSFFSHVSIHPLHISEITYLLFGTVMIIMTNMHFFKKMRL